MIATERRPVPILNIIPSDERVLCVPDRFQAATPLGPMA